MTTDLTAVGALVAVLLALTELVKFLITRVTAKRNGPEALRRLHEEQLAILKQIAKESADLHRMHSKTDQDGVPVWYVRRSLETAVVDLNQEVNKLTSEIHELLLRNRIKKYGSDDYPKAK